MTHSPTHRPVASGEYAAAGRALARLEAALSSARTRVPIQPRPTVSVRSDDLDLALRLVDTLLIDDQPADRHTAALNALRSTP